MIPIILFHVGIKFGEIMATSMPLDCYLFITVAMLVSTMLLISSASWQLPKNQWRSQKEL